MADVTGIQPEHSSPMTTCLVLPVIKFSIQPMMSSFMLYDFSFPISLLCGTVSNAVLEIHVNAIDTEPHI